MAHQGPGTLRPSCCLGPQSLVGYLLALVSPDNQVGSVQTQRVRPWPHGRACGAALFPLPLGAEKCSSWCASDTRLTPAILGSLRESRSPRRLSRMPQTPAGAHVSMGPASSIPDSLTRSPACANAHTALGLSVPCSPWGQLIARHSPCSINTCVGPSFPADTTAVLWPLVKQTLNAAHQSHLAENWTGPPGRLAGGLRSRRLLSPCLAPC